jgi:hypothetical protein
VTLLNQAALLVSAGGLAAVAISIARRRYRIGLAFALDLWMGAGLLLLSGGPGWDRIAVAAGVLVVRRIAGLGLRFVPV